MTASTFTHGRLLGVDLARFMALISMFIAHTAPTPGPFGVLNLSEFLTVALFAMLLGVSADLSADRMAFPTLFASSVVRAIALIALGLWSDSWGAQVEDVLPFLGLLSIFAAVLVYLPSWVLGIIAALSWWFTPWAMVAFSELHVNLTAQGSLFSYFTLWMFEARSYRVFTMIAWACVGIILIRLMRAWGVAGDIAGAVIATVAAGSLWWHVSHLFEFFPYTGNHWEVAFDTLLAVGAICWCSVVARIFASKESVLAPFAVCGRMTLSLYLGQLAILAAYVKYAPQMGWSPTDDSWVMMFTLIIAAMAFSWLWHRLFRSTFAYRGPVETLLSWVSARG